MWADLNEPDVFQIEGNFTAQPKQMFWDFFAIPGSRSSKNSNCSSYFL